MSRSCIAHHDFANSKVRMQNPFALNSHREAFHDILCHLMLAAVANILRLHASQ